MNPAKLSGVFQSPDYLGKKKNLRTSRHFLVEYRGCDRGYHEPKKVPSSQLPLNCLLPERPRLWKQVDPCFQLVLPLAG